MKALQDVTFLLLHFSIAALICLKKRIALVQITLQDYQKIGSSFTKPDNIVCKGKF